MVLAAGQGKRMKSRLPKVMHPVCGVPMVGHVVGALQSAGIAHIVVVTGAQGEEVRTYLGESVNYAYQDPPLGTGDAVVQGIQALPPGVEEVLVVPGDTPLVNASVFQALIDERRHWQATASLVTTELPDPAGYGRVVRDEQGRVEAVVEEADATPDQKQITEINAGIYSFQAQALVPTLERLGTSNRQQEYYLTDLFGHWSREGQVVSALPVAAELVLGVNNRQQLAQVAEVMQRRLLEHWMLQGVTVEDPANTYVEASVELEADTVLRPYTFLAGESRVREGAVIGPFVRINDSVLEQDVQVENAVLEGVHLESGVKVGPYVYLRRGTYMEAGSKAGTFVEMKQSRVGAGSKVPHQSYIGDTVMGSGVNIGAGTITCNYDGWEKHQTIIEDEAFIGSNTNLVAPVRVGRGAVTGAGSTISRDVPAYALALERSQEKIVEEWVKRKMEKKRARKEKHQE